MDSNNYCVYIHVDPRNGNLVYVGKGKYGRAWDVTRARAGHHEHSEWMKEFSSFAVNSGGRLQHV